MTTPKTNTHYDPERERLEKVVTNTLYYLHVGADSFEGARVDRLRYEKAVRDLAAYDREHSEEDA